MSHAIRGNGNAEPVRVLGRGLRARRGVRMTFRTLRDAVGFTQIAVSEKSGINQADISRLENRGELDDCQVATLQRYIKALGGEFELVARFGEKRITVVGTSSTDTNADGADKGQQ
jgi:transcriptional regulator with XRE-family HTH domain